MGSAQINDHINEVINEACKKVAEAVYPIAYSDGVEDTMDNVKSIISDGLRHGSPKCGKAMHYYQNGDCCWLR